MAPTADDVVVSGVGEHHVVAATGVDRVIAGLAVDLVRTPDVDDAGAGAGRRLLGDAGEELRHRVRAALGVVQQDDDPQQQTEVERLALRPLVPGGAGEHRAVGDHHAQDVAVVAHDDVGVGQVPAGVVVAADVGAGATEQQVAVVGPPGHGGQGEHRRAAADDVVGAETAEHDVVAAAALDVVVAVSRCLVAGQHVEVAGRVAPRADRSPIDRAVTLDDVIAELRRRSCRRPRPPAR